MKSVAFALIALGIAAQAQAVTVVVARPVIVSRPAVVSRPAAPAPAPHVEPAPVARQATITPTRTVYIPPIVTQGQRCTDDERRRNKEDC